jgi:hypothetical protein
LSESTDHVTEVAHFTDWHLSLHLVHEHGHRDVWPFDARDVMLERHGELHPNPTTQVSSDNSRVSTDKINLEVGDGQPRTEDEVSTTTIEAPLARVDDLAAQVASLEASLAEANGRVRVALDNYKVKVCDQVRKYLDNGQLCKEEARNIINELDLDMRLGWVVSVTAEITLKGVDDDMGPVRGAEDAIADAVKETLMNHVTTDDPDWAYVSVDISCEEDDD